jgi:bacillithiol system protein YtxJ
MEWKVLNEDGQLQQIIRDSESRPQIIFKHSTRCSISAVAKGRLDKGTPPENTDFYYLDLIRYRTLSNKIADTFKVHHESPQVLIIRNGRCVYDESHMGINLKEILQLAEK